MQLLADLWFQMLWKLVSIYHQYHFLVVWAIRFIRRDFGGFRFARIHPDYGLFKAWDYLTITYCKLQGGAVNGGVEYCAVLQCTRVVNLNGITNLCLCHFPFVYYSRSGTTAAYFSFPLYVFRLLRGHSPGDDERDMVMVVMVMVELLSYLAEEVDAILSNVAVITIQE